MGFRKGLFGRETAKRVKTELASSEPFLHRRIVLKLPAKV